MTINQIHFVNTNKTINVASHPSAPEDSGVVTGSVEVAADVEAVVSVVDAEAVEVVVVDVEEMQLSPAHIPDTAVLPIL